MKRSGLFIVALLAAISAAMPTILQAAKPGHMGCCITVAHRGCHLSRADGTPLIPENCPAAVAMASRYGYKAIECDVRYTRDSVMVIMHDMTINRTMRRAEDYSPVTAPVRLDKTTFAELRSRYVLASSDPALRTPIPTLEEMLLECKRCGVIPMLHTAITEAYALAASILGDDWIAFSRNHDVFKARDYSSDCLILLDPQGATAAQAIEMLRGVSGRRGISTMKYGMLDAGYIRTLRDAGLEVQASIFKAPHDQRALHDGVTLLLSDWWWAEAKGHRSTRRGVVKSGGSWSTSLGHAEFGAATLRLRFCGSVEVDFCGRHYSLHRDTPGEEIIGARLYDGGAAVSVQAAEGTRVRIRTDYYEL